jgi:hypothetical protein
MAVDDSYTKSLLHFDGADASTTFTDESGKTWTRSGNTQIDTAQYKFGGASCFFDGSGDYLYSDGSSDFVFGTGDFTVDFWWRPDGALSTYMVLIDWRPSGTLSGNYPVLVFIPTASPHIVYQIGNTVSITGTATISAGNWYHIAIARSGTSTKLFINGNQDGSTASDSTDYIVGANRPTLDNGYDTVADQELLAGWIDELRISKGVARWITNFTPPITPFGSGGQVIFFS